MDESKNIYPVHLTTEHDIRSDNHYLIRSKNDESVLLDGRNGIRIYIDIDSNNYPASIVGQSLKRAFDSILAKFY